MRHALLTELWLPTIGGSIQLYDELYGRAMPPGDFVHVIAGGVPGDERLDKDYPRPVSRFDNRRFPWLKPESTLEYARMFARALEVCRRERVEVMHCARVIPEGIVALAVKRALGVPYTVWAHGEEVSMFQRYPSKRAVMPAVFRGARAVLANSSYSRAEAIRAGAPEHLVHVVNPAVDAHGFEGPFDTADLRARWGLEGRRVVISVGRLTRRKGHDVMLRALARLRAQGALDDVAWLVLSDGELEAELRRLCTALDLDAVTRWVGPVPRAELARYYACADVFAMPNRTLHNGDVEGFGLVFLEASASGLPVLGGRSGGVPDAVRDGRTGLLVDGASIEAVADGLRTLLGDAALRRRLGDEGRRWARTRTWERAAARVRALAAGEEVPDDSITPLQYADGV